MINLKEILEHFVEEGYSDKNAEARVCQDIILMAIANSTLSRNVTIKGGVVMRSLTGNRRRATQDMDIDFIRYSIADESIDRFIGEINCLDGVSIVRFGDIEELSQQEYNGKRVFVKISDHFGGFIESKIDLGVHKQLEIEQKEYCFDIAFDDAGMREDGIEDVIKRVMFVFSNNTFKNRVDKSDKRWLDEDVNNIFEGIINYLERLR